MSLSNSQIKRASRITGVPEWLLGRVDRKEGSGTSPKGARGELQLMPDTARYLARKYKINTNTPWGNLLGGAYYLKEQFNAFKRWDWALAAYNAGPNAVREYHGIPPFRETQDYVRAILHGEVPTDAGSSNGRMAGSEPAGAGSTPASASIQPAYTEEDAALEGLQALTHGTYNPTQGIESLIRAAESASAAASSAPAQSPSGVAPGEGLPAGASGQWQKYVTLAPGADRAGVSTTDAIKMFVGQLGKRAGSRLTITTGTNHNQMTVNGNVSAHWDGHAADIAATGARLTRLGRLALIQAGMSRREAMKVKGGLFNIGGYQIIFNTTEGGNHWNHLHVGIRR